VKQVFQDRKVAYEERNIKDLNFLKEAQAHNARAMPFLVDTVAGVAMGESDEIIDYASEHSF
jgi:hypothetical protein